MKTKEPEIDVFPSDVAKNQTAQKSNKGLIGSIPIIGNLLRKREAGKEYNPLSMTPVVGELLFGKPTKHDIEKKIKEDMDATTPLRECDVSYPVIGHLCGKLNYDPENPIDRIVHIVGYILLLWVIVIDLVWDLLFVIWDIGSNVIGAVPVIGPLLETIESLEIDDYLDAISGAIVFVFCGPVEMFIALMFELPEGPLEYVPSWTIVIGIWFFVVRPAKRRLIEKQKEGIINDLGDIDEGKLEELYGEGKPAKISSPQKSVEKEATEEETTQGINIKF